MNRNRLIPYMFQKTIALFLVLLFIGSCAVNPVTGRKELILLSEEDELRWGKEMYPGALWGEVGGGGIYHDPPLERYLTSIIKRLNSVSHRPNLPVNFVIQNSSIPNAWAIPGHVAITRGLLAELENEAEFAFVMGHEMGHVAARHSARHYTSQVLVSGLLVGTAAALSGKDGADLVLGLGALGSSLLLLKFSRDDELEADRLGLEYMSRAGYRPEEALKAHKTLEKAVREYLDRVGRKSRGGDFLSELFSTHPRTEVRLSEIKRIIKERKQKLRGDGINRERFLKMTRDLREVDRAYHHYDRALVAYEKGNLKEAEDYLQRAIQMNDRQAPFYNLLGNIHLKGERYPDAESAFRQALRQDGNYQPAHEGLGILSYLRKDYSGALRHLGRSLSLFPGSPVSNYYTGLSYFQMGRYRKAIPHLKAFEQAAPRHRKIHGYLGLAYDALYDYPSAYREYTLQVRIDPYSELGRHARQRAAELRPLLIREKRR
jgi:predicted Zn-dependent protease